MGFWERQVSKSIGNYSEAEVDTKQKWIDGKTIYRKVVDCGALPNSTTKNVTHGISGIDTRLAPRGFTNSTTVCLPLPYASVASAGNIVRLSWDNTNIYFETESDLTSYTSTYVILEYTKT